jgi:hypothetical protein
VGNIHAYGQYITLPVQHTPKRRFKHHINTFKKLQNCPARMEVHSKGVLKSMFLLKRVTKQYITIKIVTYFALLRKLHSVGKYLILLRCVEVHIHSGP